MGFKQKKVGLSAIDPEDDTYRITTQTSIDDLVDSIKDIGIINPPFIIKKKSEYCTVCGFRRIEVGRCLGWRNIEAKILDADTKNLEYAKLAIADNLLQRPLNLIETSRSIHLLSDCLDDNRSLVEFASSLGLSKNPSMIRKVEKLYYLSRPVQNSILSNTISLSIALELGLLQTEAGIAFVALFENLNASLNKQREIITSVREIALRENISILEVLQDNDLCKILNHTETDRTQKTQKIRVYLKARRFPAIASAEKVFQTHLKDLKLGSGVKLISPPNFESTTYTIMLYFKNLAELEARSATLDSIIQNPILNKIMG
jgi:ParB family chromosome partitioning protein